MITLVETLTGWERLWPMCMKDLGWLVDGKHCKRGLKCNFMTQKVNAILGITNKSINFKLRAFAKVAKYH